MSQNFESSKNSKLFLIIIQLYHSKSIGMKSNQVNFIFFIKNRKDCSKNIVQSISFHNKLNIRNSMCENGS